MVRVEATEREGKTSIRVSCGMIVIEFYYLELVETLGGAVLKREARVAREADCAGGVQVLCAICAACATRSLRSARKRSLVLARPGQPLIQFIEGGAKGVSDAASTSKNV